MAGHSKWANIKHKKAAADAKRGKVWTRLIKEIQVAARMGGGDIDSNPRLRLAVEKAYDANMPKDNVNRAIQRGVGGVDGASYEEIRYEGYGIGGAAVKVEGRQRGPAYTAAVTRVWRAALDALAQRGDAMQPQAAWLATLAGLSEGQQDTLGAYSRPWK